MNDKKLYIEYRVYFNPNTNQELLSIMAEQAQEEITNLFEHMCDPDDMQPAPAPHDVTYEVVMQIDEVEK